MIQFSKLSLSFVIFFSLQIIFFSIPNGLAEETKKSTVHATPTTHSSKLPTKQAHPKMDATSTTTKTVNTTKASVLSQEEQAAQDAEDEKIKDELAKDLLQKEQEMRKQMMNWSRQLGVTCTYCHNQNNFKSEEKTSFKIAKKHWKMVRLLNEEVFTERDKGGAHILQADCYMCHRGVSNPDYKEPHQNLLK